MANEAIYEKAQKQRELEGMGTTVCAARFSPTKQRLYVAHVGDSRIYRFRRGALKQMTADHTMKDFGVRGESATHLSRAVGIWPRVPIDIVLAKPQPGDVYLLCSDGLSKMVSDDELAKVLANEKPQEAVDRLIAAANAHGGMDNITVIVVKIEPIKKKRAA
jgi:protein phosphatase